MKAKAKDWLRLKVDEVNRQIRSYPWYRAFLLVSAVVGFLASFFSVWDQTFTLRMKIYDQAVIDFVASLQSPTSIYFFSLITQLGHQYFIVSVFLVLALVMVAKRRKKAAAVALISLAGSFLLSLFFKRFFGRLRPFGCINNGDCFSFPSGHATIAVYFYGLLSYLTFRFLSISLKTYLIISFFLTLLVTMIAFSRLFLSVHYLSDIFGGIFLGSAWLMLAIFVIDVLYNGLD